MPDAPPKDLEISITCDVPAMPTIAGLRDDTDISSADVAALAALSERLEHLAVTISRELAKRGASGSWCVTMTAVKAEYA